MSAFIELAGALPQPLLERSRTVLANTDFRAGKATAGAWAARVKHNCEADVASPEVRALGRALFEALSAMPLFRSAALPRRISEFIFARYIPGMAYGVHLDDPVFGSEDGHDQLLRTDLAATVFLSSPEAYDGGELRIHAPDGLQAIKLPAGHAILYPASSLHEVSEVTRGERLVAVCWIQSLVRDPGRRELLLDLDLARSELRRAAPDALATARVDKTYANLVRRWAEV